MLNELENNLNTNRRSWCPAFSLWLVQSDSQLLIKKKKIKERAAIRPKRTSITASSYHLHQRIFENYLLSFRNRAHAEVSGSNIYWAPNKTFAFFSPRARQGQLSIGVLFRCTRRVSMEKQLVFNLKKKRVKTCSAAINDSRLFSSEMSQKQFQCLALDLLFTAVLMLP